MNLSNTDSNVLALRPAVRYTSNMRSIEPVFDPTPDPLRSIAMSVAFAEPVLDRPTAARRAVAPAPTRARPRRPGPGVGPTARPRRLRFAAPPVVGSRSAARACQAAPVLQGSPTWHLTERGLAVVLVVAAALVAASITVVGLTALRITGESYRPSHSAVAPVVVDR